MDTGHDRCRALSDLGGCSRGHRLLDRRIRPVRPECCYPNAGLCVLAA